MLQSHSWPGNIRELANVIEHASILSNRLPITVNDLPRQFGSSPTVSIPMNASGKSLRQIEMETIHSTLEMFNGNKTAAAQQLGISLKTLYNKLNSQTGRKAA